MGADTGDDPGPCRRGVGHRAPITAGFHKLLLYNEGGFLVGHRDTGKAPGMSATLVAALPSSFAGGEPVVRHRGHEARLDLACWSGRQASHTESG